MDKREVALKLLHLARTFTSSESITAWLESNARVDNSLIADEFGDERNKSLFISGRLTIREIEVPVSILLQDPIVKRFVPPGGVIRQVEDYVGKDGKTVFADAVDRKALDFILRSSMEEVIQDILSKWIYPEYIDRIESESDLSFSGYYNNIGGFGEVKENGFDSTVKFELILKPEN